LFILKNRPPAFQWALNLLELSAQATAPAEKTRTAAVKAMILSGGAKSVEPEELQWIRPLVKTALTPFQGTVISGGTAVGVPGCVGDAAAELVAGGAKYFKLIGYIPHNLPHDAPKDTRYDLRVCGTHGFTAEQIIRSWRDLLADGIQPSEVLCLGFGGGPVSWVEYCVALALGATAAVIPVKNGDVAHALINDPLWARLPNLFPLPPDPATVRALVVPPSEDIKDDRLLDATGEAFHEKFVAGSSGRLPDNMKPWPELADTFKRANREQARYAVTILNACGFAVRPSNNPVVFDHNQFTVDEIDRMAELEHGRWNAERLRDGWRPGKQRDHVRQIHDCLVPWSDVAGTPWSGLPESIKEYDREAVREFPRILAKAGLEVCRR
jgi:hypothetical protein